MDYPYYAEMCLVINVKAGGLATQTSRDGVKNYIGSAYLHLCSKISSCQSVRLIVMGFIFSICIMTRSVIFYGWLGITILDTHAIIEV